jgi:hypothetical protein
VTVQEAYDYAARAVEESFDTAGLLATEHSQLKGESAVQFNLARLVPDEPVDLAPEAAELVTERAELDERIQDLQLRRSDMSTEDYYQEIEVLMLELARIEQEIETQIGIDAEADMEEVTTDFLQEGMDDDIDTSAGDIRDEIGVVFEVGLGMSIGEDLEIIGVDLLQREDDAGDVEDAADSTGEIDD